MKLFRAVRTEEGYTIILNGWWFVYIVATLTAFGFAVHMADRLIFG